MNKYGYIYITEQMNGEEVLLHNGLPMIGVGRTNDVERRMNEHNSGSKNTVTVEEKHRFDCDELNLEDKSVEKRTHKILLSLGYRVVTRNKSRTEVFSGNSKKTVEGIVNKGDVITLDLIKRIIKNITNVDVFKSELTLHPHQYEAYNFIKQKWDDGETNVLLSHKPRSGKTFITYNYLINDKPKNVLLLTQYPSLNKQWEKDFKYLRGHEYNIIISGDVDKVVLDDNRENFVMISLQDAKGSDMTDCEVVDGLKKQKFNHLKKVKWDLIVFDEIHKGKETIKTDKLLNSLKYCKLLGLSATPTKNILRGTFKKENIHRYDLKDEQLLNKTIPEIYNNPKISYHLFDVGNQIVSDMEYFTKEEGFTFNKFSKVEDGRLVYHNDHIKLFNYIFGIGRNKKRKIRRLIDKSNCILMYIDNNQCQPIIRDLLDKIVGDIYDVHFTNSDVNNSNTLIDKIEKEYQPKNGKKSIIIANKQLTTGLTLKYCDMVIFLNDWKSMDEYIQASYRCQSSDEGKNECYVLDFNPGRCFNILHKYMETISTFKGSDISVEIKEYLECLPIFEYMGGDVKEVDFESFKNRLSDYSGIDDKFFPNSLLMSEEDIKKEIGNIMLLNGLKGDVSHSSIELDGDNGIEPGKNVVNNPTKTNNKEVKEEKDTIFTDMIGTINYLKDSLPILCLTNRFEHDSIESIFNMIDNDDELKRELIDNLMLDNFIDKN